jgi:CRISPR-associated protein Csd1
MFVQALAQYADSYLRDELNNVAWETKPVPWLIEIFPDGGFNNVISRIQQETRGKRSISVALPLSVPRSPVNRNNANLSHPLLAADSIDYVLGVGAWTKDREVDKHTKHHEAFVALVRSAAGATQDGALKACALFYENAAEVEKAREMLKEVKAGALVALSVDGPVVERPATQSYWRNHYDAAYAKRVGGVTGECMISGAIGPIAPTHEKIKGTAGLGGQASGVLLMSFDKEAFRSYGWEKNENSPVSTDRAMAYVLALNDLLRYDKGHRHDIAGIAFIYWLKRPQEFNPFDLLDRADETQVEALLSFDPGADPDPNQFYMAGVSGNGGRLRVRYWVTDSLSHIKENLKAWFLGLRVAPLRGDGGPVRLWQLQQALDREGAPPPNQTIALLRRAVEGPSNPLGHSMLAAALGPLRHGGEWTPARLGLIRMTINDLTNQQQKGETPMTEALDTGQKNPAYLCGRLLAEFENLQFAVSKASGEAKVNVTVADRYYSLASTNPQIAFPKIEDLGRKHMQKLRRDRPGAASAIDQRLLELHGLLDENTGGRFPSMLSLEDQGRFALGYHHQRAASFAQARANQARTNKENLTETAPASAEEKEN